MLKDDEGREWDWRGEVRLRRLDENGQIMYAMSDALRHRDRLVLVQRIMRCS